jgi:hypothetical protein
MERRTCIEPATQTSCHVRIVPFSTYTCLGRESNVSSDFPSGYGGSRPSIRQEVLHRNTAFERMYGHLRSADIASSELQKSRFKFPVFSEVKQGIPIYTKKHRQPGTNTDRCTEVGGVKAAADLIASHRNSPFAIQQRTTPVLKQDTMATRPSDH